MSENPLSPDHADRETVERERAALEELATAQRSAQRADRPDPVFHDIAARLAAIRQNVLADREHHVVADIVEVLARRLEAMERRVGEIDRQGRL